MCPWLVQCHVLLEIEKPYLCLWYSAIATGNRYGPPFVCVIVWHLLKIDTTPHWLVVQCNMLHGVHEYNEMLLEVDTAQHVPVISVMRYWKQTQGYNWAPACCCTLEVFFRSFPPLFGMMPRLFVLGTYMYARNFIWANDSLQMFPPPTPSPLLSFF